MKEEHCFSHHSSLVIKDYVSSNQTSLQTHQSAIAHTFGIVVSSVFPFNILSQFLEEAILEQNDTPLKSNMSFFGKKNKKITPVVLLCITERVFLFSTAKLEVEYHREELW